MLIKRSRILGFKIDIEFYNSGGSMGIEARVTKSRDYIKPCLAGEHCEVAHNNAMKQVLTGKNITAVNYTDGYHSSVDGNSANHNAGKVIHLYCEKLFNLANHATQ
jgi:hypothetical protein